MTSNFQFLDHENLLHSKEDSNIELESLWIPTMVHPYIYLVHLYWSWYALWSVRDALKVAVMQIAFA